jgi:hypothetical protein
MAQKIKLDDKEYEVDSLTEQAKTQLKALQFASHRLEELSNMQALLQRAKKSYIESLKLEMLSEKSGFLFGDS